MDLYNISSESSVIFVFVWQLDFEVSTMGCSQDRLMQWTQVLPLTVSPLTAVALEHTLCLTMKSW